MIITVGQNFHACGKLIRDAEYGEFGPKHYHKTKLVIGSGNKDEPVIYVTTVFENADACRDLKKGDVVMASGVIRNRKYGEKEFLDYEAHAVCVQPRIEPVAQENPDSWPNIGMEEVPF